MRTLSLILLTAAFAPAQNVVLTELKSLYEGHRRNIMESAEKIPADRYSFRPSDDVMTVRGQFGHIADVNYSICSAIKDEPNPWKGNLEKRELDKAGFLAELTKSYDYCMAALNGTTDSALGQTIKRGTSERTRAWYALHLLEHMTLHYGNLITYMRIQKMVPPETERRQLKK
jgi:uncharacterized damage-inducible protein DinB